MTSTVSCFACAYTSLSPPLVAADMSDFSPGMATSIREVEELLHYKFNRVSLLEEALTHPSYPHSANYQRLEFVGDAVLGSAVANLLFTTYPDLNPGQLTRLRVANVSTEKLARAALALGLHRYVRHVLPEDALKKIRDFATAVEQEEGTVVFGGEIKPPKILADTVESVAAAVYIDCGFDLKASWPIFKRLLEPLVTLELLQEQSQPVTTLLELCKRHGKKVDITQSKQGKSNNIAQVVVDGKPIASASSKQWENARILAAKNALKELSYHTTIKPLSQRVDSKQESSSDTRTPTKRLSHLESAQESSYSNERKIGCTGMCYLIQEQDGWSDIEGAKQKLNKLCDKRKWPKPTYKMEQEIGPGHGLRFICSARVDAGVTKLLAMGVEKSRKKHAENSAASLMLLALQESKYLLF